METKTGEKKSLSGNTWKNLGQIGIWTLAITGLTIGLYVAALSLYWIKPYWVQGNNMHITIAFGVVAFLSLAIAIRATLRLSKERTARHREWLRTQLIHAKQNAKIERLKKRCRELSDDVKKSRLLNNRKRKGVK